MILCFVNSPTATWKDLYFLVHWAEVKTRFSFRMTPLQKPADSGAFRRACKQTPWHAAIMTLVCVDPTLSVGVLLPARDTLKMNSWVLQSCCEHCWKLFHSTASGCIPYHKGKKLQEERQMVKRTFSNDVISETEIVFSRLLLEGGQIHLCLSWAQTLGATGVPAGSHLSLVVRLSFHPRAQEHS